MISFINMGKCLFLGFLLLSCSSKKGPDTMHTAQNSLSWDGYYLGEINKNNLNYLRLYEGNKSILFELIFNNKIQKGVASWDESGSVVNLNGTLIKVFVQEGRVKLKNYKDNYILNKYDDFSKNDKFMFVDSLNIKDIKDDNTHIINFPFIIKHDKNKFLKKYISIDCSSKNYKIFTSQDYKSNEILYNNVNLPIKKLIKAYCLF